MARKAGNDLTYGLAQQFLERCLRGEKSLLWPAETAWRQDALTELWHSVVESPDFGDRSFYEKLRDQLAGVSPDARRIGVDILSFYFLFPDATSAATKRERIVELLSSPEAPTGAETTPLWEAFAEGGIGNPGAYYNTGIPWMFGYVIALGLEAKSGSYDLTRAIELVACADSAAVRVQETTSRNARTMRHVCLHLMLPVAFERISSDKHRQAILAHYEPNTPSPGTEDERLLGIRNRLMTERGVADFDFYSDEVAKEWNPATSRNDPTTTIDPTSSQSMPNIFIEKSHVANRPDRTTGPNALGKALWSPQKSKSGTDIYRFMRDVRPGDVILHLTDNFGFTGLSVVESSVDSSFRGVNGTDWADQPSYRIHLKDFEQIAPPLTKSELFAAPWVGELLALLDDGLSHTFYNREPSLNQGHYLTPVPVELARILNRAYSKKTGRALVSLSEEPPDTTSPQVSDASRSALQLACISFATALSSTGIRFGGRHQAIVNSFIASVLTKRFAILSGLSGSGKTQLALKFGQWLGGDRYFVCPVRPDWTGPEALLGYEDALQPAVRGRKSWIVPPVLEFTLQAAEHSSEPHLLVLDEMNLAHVERYFADVLSGIESDEPCIPNLSQEPDGHWRLREGAARAIPLPKNLIIVGTVNVDETTYMFSPKVLDRANTFEFRVLSDELFVPQDSSLPIKHASPEERSLILSIGSGAQNLTPTGTTAAESLSALLRALHELLYEYGFEFGHRTFIEAMRFATMLRNCGTAGNMRAVDLVMMQKVLPRVHGSRREIEPLLVRLRQFCNNPIAAIEDATPSSDNMALVDPELGLPISAEKLDRMIRLLKANQYVSFTA